MPNSEKIRDKACTEFHPRDGFSPASSIYLLAGAALIIVIALLAYFPCISGDFILDDDALVTENKLIRASDGLYRIWFTTEPIDYWPVTNTTFWIEWRLWGMNPTGYRATNLILHIIEALLIWIILRKLDIPGAFLAAVIFAVHPVNVESVAWIAQRKDMLAVLFFLASIQCYLMAETQPTSQKPLYMPGINAWYMLSMLAFILAMLSKGTAVILPVVLLGIAWWLRGITKWDLVGAAPAFLAAALFTGINVWFQTHGAVTFIRTAGFAERLDGAGGVIWFYLYKALLPINLAFVYPQWQINPGDPLWAVPLLAALAVSAVLWWYRDKWSRPLLFAWGFFCVTLAPVLGFADVAFMQYSLVADHYQHTAIIGVIALAAAGWTVWRYRLHGAVRLMVNGIQIAAVLILAFLAWRQSGLYHNAFTLYQDTVNKNPNCWMIHNNWGAKMLKENRIQDAISHYQKAINLNPKYIDAQYNMGLLLVKTGNLPKAVEYFEKSLALNPNDLDVHAKLAFIFLQLGRVQEAIDHYKKSLMLRPNDPEARYSLGKALADKGQWLEAIVHLTESLKSQPEDANAHYYLGMALSNAGRFSEAIEHLNKTLRLKPDFAEAYNNRGIALFKNGQPREAIESFNQALQLKPDYPDVQNNLGNALLNTSRPDEAIVHFKKAIELKPDYINAYSNLALAYSMTNQSAQAVDAAQKALELARSKGQAAQVKQLENRLKTYRQQASPPP